MRHFPSLSSHLKHQLEGIVPVQTSAELWVWPCEVRLHSGLTMDRVYLARAAPWFEVWGVWPDQDPWKSEVDVRDVADVRDSPTRIPAHWAEKPYRGTNGGMGGAVFALIFRDGYRLTVRGGDAHDFIDYPEGYGPSDIVDVDCHLDRSSPHTILPPFSWCLFD